MNISSISPPPLHHRQSVVAGQAGGRRRDERPTEHRPDYYLSPEERTSNDGEDIRVVGRAADVIGSKCFNACCCSSIGVRRARDRVDGRFRPSYPPGGAARPSVGRSVLAPLCFRYTLVVHSAQRSRGAPARDVRSPVFSLASGSSRRWAPPRRPPPRLRVVRSGLYPVRRR